jgi:hypothetical protein
VTDVNNRRAVPAAGLTAGTALCVICHDGFTPDGPASVEVGPPVGGWIHVSAACLQGATALFDRAQAGEVQRGPSRGLIVSVICLGLLAVLCAAVIIFSITGWVGAAVVLLIGILSALRAWWSTREDGE